MRRRRKDPAAWNEPGGTEVNCFDNPGRKKYKRTVKRATKEAFLTRTCTASLAVLAILIALCPPSAAAGQSGTIRGRVVDDKGAPLTGAYLYVTSPAALGVANYITPKTGRYGVLGLTPGTYKVMVEMPGFKTVTVDGVTLSAGATVTLNFKMVPTLVEEEATTARPGPSIDRDSARAAIVLDRDLITRLPLGRDFKALLGLVPGLVFEGDTPGMRASISGAPVTANVLVQDGIIVSNPVDARAVGRINVDLIDEVVVETAGHTAEAGPAQGAYVNVVYRPGSGSTQGSISYSASGRGLVHSLWTADEVAEMDDAALPALKREHDLSLTYGAPVLEDMAWLFASVRYESQGRRAPFSYWTDPLGVRHFVYDYSERDLTGLFKLSMDVLDKFKGNLELGFSGVREPVYEADIDRLRPESATRDLDKEGSLLGRGAFSYAVDQNTRADVSVGYARYKQSLLLNEAASDKPQYYDIITGYNWGSGSLNDRETTERIRAGVSITRLQGSLFGMSHELVAGAEYETMTSISSVWKADNLIYNYADGSPYTFGEIESPSSGETVGWGLIGFYLAPATEDGMDVRTELKRIGAFVQDTVKIGGRLSLYGGLRFDRSEARFPAIDKGASASLSASLGNALVKPLMGYNIFGSVSLAAWEKGILWNTLSPRAGLSFDLLGNGRTVLKGSWARIPEYLGLGYSRDLAQLDPWNSHDFLWFDENADGVADTDDTFALMSYDYRVYRSEFYKQAVDPNLSAPTIEEWSAGLEQELVRGFSLSARYISRRHTNIIGNVLYDPSTETHWGTVDKSPEGWWVPFSTVVPETGDYPDVPVTLYFRSATAPAYFERIENVPELAAKYRTVEFSFHKRFSHNWQLFGSLAWNRSTGTTSVASRWSAGYSSVILTPNSFINISETDTLLQDRPLVARLAGTVRFPWDIDFSFLLKAQSGTPWGRTVTIIPPTAWATANNVDKTGVLVHLESPGARRFDAWKDMDVRVGKEFLKAGRSVFAVSVDVFNLLGDKYRTLDLNDGGTWKPDGEGVSTGVRTLSGTYGTYSPLWGTRVVRLNLSLKF
jgi:hypothetical protein